MNHKPLEWKVGLFVFFGLVVLVVLLLQFSKGTSLFSPPAYRLYLTARNVGGLKTQASVLMAGVQIGRVSNIRLNPGGTNVEITLRISSQYVIHNDARFVIEQSGFLGDQFVAISPINNQGPAFAPEDHASLQEPLNLQEVARSAQSFIQRIDETAKLINDSIADVRRYLLNRETLTNFAVAAVNMRIASEHAVSAVNDFEGLIATNTPSVSLSASNLVLFSAAMDQFAAALNGVLATNQPGIASAVSNIDSSTAVLKNLLENAQSGRGLAGTLLQNEPLATNVAEIVSNLSITTSNLNRLGLWGILWSKKPPHTHPPPAAPSNASKHPPN